MNANQNRVIFLGLLQIYEAFDPTIEINQRWALLCDLIEITTLPVLNQFSWEMVRIADLTLPTCTL